MKAPLSPPEGAAQGPPALALRPATALSLASGVLVFLAFPGVGWWPLGLIGWVPALLALNAQPPGRALILGWITGFTLHTLGLYWLVRTLRDYAGTGVLLAVLCTLLVAGFQAGRFACVAWLTARAQARGASLSVAYTLAFLAAEALFPALFPWSFAAVLHDLPALLQSAELFGPGAVSLLLLLPNLAFASAIVTWRSEGRVFRGRLAALVAVFPAGALFGALRMQSVDAATRAAPTGVVELVQANLPANAKDGLLRQLELTRSIQSGARPDLIAWSEASFAVTTWEHDAQGLAASIFRAAGGVPVLFGAVLARKTETRNDIFFNSALLASDPAKPLRRYDKQRLLPFAEYLPFADAFPFLRALSPNSGRFEVATRPLPLELGEHELAVFICYEDIFPSFVNRIVASGAPDLLVNLTNDAWFGDSAEPWLHLALSKLRAVEHRRYFVRATNSGVSAIIDPVGRVVTMLRPFESSARASSIAWLRGRTLFEVWGEAPIWLVAAISVVMAFIPRRWSTGRR